MAERWYSVSGYVTVSAYIYVRATSPEDAMKRARVMKDATVELCPYGVDRAGADPTAQVIVESADGSFVPQSAEVEDPPAEFTEGEE